MRRTVPAIALAAAVVVLPAGCGRAPAAPAVAGCSASPGALTVTTAVLDGRADPAPHRVAVPLNGTVQVRVSADRVLQVHIHGYDLEYDAAPGTPGCVSFTADRAGLFDVEAHPDTLLVQLEVR
ncbi:hypothetical protein [Paractinoplanes toevensis]|uniref:Plastocyanin-like domain-containing protein n=1 Tax=Paractinoplanes toevensis TaxID=571911 RepID=A0A919TCE8_9ACTN|nr:hypothetical protein [Actinoplanes toevensis]GIM93429.1 hypothetical protein Ato02nite_052220 [Actinoplanes toevensis]